MAVVTLLFGGTAVNEAVSDPGSYRVGTGLHTSRSLFLEKCARCHEPERAYGSITDRLVWMRTVAAMAIKDRGWMPPEAVRDVLAYHRYYPIHMNTLFQNRCGGCHVLEKIRQQQRSAAQWRTMITYMARRQGFDMTPEERELLVAGLRR